MAVASFNSAVCMDPTGGGWGSKFGTFLPLRTLTLDTADAERGQTQMQEMNICNNQDTIANKTLDKKYCLYTEEK